MRPQIIIITHTDWEQPDPNWPRQPKLPFRRDDRASWDKVMDELGRIARVDSIAFGCRGTFDPPAVACLPIAREAYRHMAHQPSVTFWADTVGLPDISHNLDGKPFDFANSLHIELAWTHFFKHFFDHFKDAKLTRSSKGNVLIPWWGIDTQTGHGFTNQERAQRLLDYIDQKVFALGLGGCDHIVDKTWASWVPALRAYGVHNWFSGHHNPKSFTVRHHNGVSTGVVVPGFTDPNTKVETIPNNGETARAGLAACAQCDYVILEGATDFVENAQWIREADGKTHNLDAIRAVTSPSTEPEPEPVPGGLMHLAITPEPILTWKTGVLVVSPLAPNRYAMRWTQPAEDTGQAGYPDPTSKKFLCLNPDGSTTAKGPTVDDPNWKIGEWESSQPVQSGDTEIRWFTQNAEKTESAVIVYGLQQFQAA